MIAHHYKSKKRARYLFVLGFMFLLGIIAANAQFLISYPGTAQQGLTVCYSQSTLTVRVDVATASSNNTVTVQLPTGVNYVEGTVAKSNIANLQDTSLPTLLFWVPTMDDNFVLIKSDFAPIVSLLNTANGGI